MPYAVLQTIQAWVLSLLIYPGLVFGVAMFVAGEWLVAGIRPATGTRPAPRGYSAPGHHRALPQPVYDVLKLAGRRRGAVWPGYPPGALSARVESPDIIWVPLSLAALLGPVLALALLPLPGSPLLHQTGTTGDLIIVVALLAVHPLAVAALRLRQQITPGCLVALRGAQDVGRLLVGSVPVLAATAALVEVSAVHSLQTAGLSTPPERPEQTLVRLLAGVVLLVALPWWQGGHQLAGIGTAPVGVPTQEAGGEAAVHAGSLLQTAALSAFWQAMVLPAPGDLVWAVAVAVGGTLFAYAGIRLVAERWVATRRERDAAGLLWAVALPPAALALVLALWPAV